MEFLQVCLAVIFSEIILEARMLPFLFFLCWTPVSNPKCLNLGSLHSADNVSVSIRAVLTATQELALALQLHLTIASAKK